jgi:fido (protein-threonine AMPylation protein)
MATPQERLAASLRHIEKIQQNGRRVFRSSEFSRLQREQLLRHGFLQPIIKGWLISASPGISPADTTPWYASFWEFCARYCDTRFRNKWHLSPEQSLLLHAERSAVPVQVLVYSPEGTNNMLALPFGTSLFDLKQAKWPPEDDLVKREGLRLFSLEQSLICVPEAFFTRHPIEAQVALSGIRDTSSLLHRLLDGGHSVVAGRLAGALRRVGRTEMADEILAAMKGAGYSVRESDPFEPGVTVGAPPVPVSPIVARLHAMWGSMRGPVIEAFPKATGLPKNKKAYLRAVDDVFKSDAYHSLSIEGYRVTPELIEKVASGAWDPERHEADRKNRDALAARGYWQAFQLVRETIDQIIAGGQAGALVATAHRNWYRELFQPCVAAGLIPARALAGYRNDAVFLRGSRYVPPRHETAREAMPAFLDLLRREPEPSVRAVLGHWLFGYIHPYPDGNGRMARFVMNAMLASGGYRWTVIRVEDRDAYLEALDSASIDMDIQPFAAFIAERVRASGT